MTSFVAELRRRNVLKVGAAYALVSWILIEAGSVLLPTFGAPEWFFKGYVLLIIAGFLLSLVFAWVLEWTPEGVKLEKDVDRSASVSHQTGSRLTYGIIALLVVALVISVTLNITGLRKGGPVANISQAASSIAVLPFESRSTDPDNALFADGIHDDLLTSLAGIQALKVISRTSVLKYRNPTRNLPEIARELGVTTVLEGSVARSGDNVRVNVQLIDAQTDQHIWAKIYDRVLSAKNIFAIQSEIATEITNALRTQLTPEEQGRMAVVPTENLAAYSLYMAGRDNIYKRRLETLQEARQQFQDAIDLDPSYSLAYSGLADSILLLTINHQAIPFADAIESAERALTRALVLDDRNADAYASLGLLKMTQAEHDKTAPKFSEAEAAFRKAIELSPNHAQAYAWFASLKKTQFDFQSAAELNKKSLELDPLARIPRSNLAALYAQMGRNDEALAEWLECVRINPEWPTAYENVGNELAAVGRLDEAYAWSVKARELSTDPMGGQSLIGVYLQLGETERAGAILAGLPVDHPFHPIVDGFLKLFDRKYHDAIESWEAAIAAGFQDQMEFLSDPLSDAALLIGDETRSMKYVLRKAPALQEPGFKITVWNTRQAIRYAYLLLLQDPDDIQAMTLLNQSLKFVESAPRLGIAGHGIRDVQILALQGKTTDALTRLNVAFDEGFRGSRLFENWNLDEDPFLESIRDTDEFRLVESKITAANDIMRRRVDSARTRGNVEAILASTRRNSAANRSKKN